jgi:hypothetical protein
MSPHLYFCPPPPTHTCTHARTHARTQAARRIFQALDRDYDGLLSADEMGLFQTHVYGLQSGEEAILQRFEVRGRALTLYGEWEGEATAAGGHASDASPSPPANLLTAPPPAHRSWAGWTARTWTTAATR